VCRASIAGAALLSALLAVGVIPKSALSQTATSAGTPPTGSAIFWAGPFAGAQVLGSLSTVSTTESMAATGALFHHFDTFASGAGGGLNFGYNWLPWGNKWLAGVVVDIDFLSDSGGHVFETMDNLVASGQMRVGYLMTPSLLCYGQTGVSLARKASRSISGGRSPSRAGSPPAT
jgi:hypothetical protein